MTGIKVDPVKSHNQTKRNRLHAVMRPQDFRANRLMLLFVELSREYRFELTILHDKDADPQESCPEATGWKLPFSERSVSFSSLEQPENAKELVASLMEKPDHQNLLLVSCEAFLPLLKAAKTECGVKTWYDQREIFIDGVGDSIPKKETERLRNWEKSFLPFVDLVTTVDSHEGFWEKRYESLGLAVHVLFNVPPRSPQLIEKARAGAESKQLDGVIDLAMIGGIRINQGLEVLLEAVDGLPFDFRLQLIGLANRSFQRDFERAAAKKGLTNLSVHYQDWMPYDRLISTISQYHVGLMLKQPSEGQYGMIRRGNSRKPFTYIHAGLPCISPDHQSVCLQVEEEGAGLRLDVSDPKRIAQGLMYILSDRDRYLAMARSGIKAIESKYCWEIEWERMRTKLEAMNFLSPSCA